MAVPVIDFSKLEGDEREKTMAEIAKGCEGWGFFQVCLTFRQFYNYERRKPN